MMDLKKLDKTIKELETSTDEVREFSKAYKEIANLKEEFAEMLRLLKENNDKFSSLEKDILSNIEKIGVIQEQKLSSLSQNVDAKLKEQNKHTKNIASQTRLRVFIYTIILSSGLGATLALFLSEKFNKFLL